LFDVFDDLRTVVKKVPYGDGHERVKAHLSSLYLALELCGRIMNFHAKNMKEKLGSKVSQLCVRETVSNSMLGTM
jgi:hypothetical protein